MGVQRVIANSNNGARSVRFRQVKGGKNQKHVAYNRLTRFLCLCRFGSSLTG